MSEQVIARITERDFVRERVRILSELAGEDVAGLDESERAGSTAQPPRLQTILPALVQILAGRR